MRIAGRKRNKMKNWYSAHNNNHGVVADQDTGRTVAVVFEKSDSTLLASSPTLLEALERLLDCPELNLESLEDETIKAIRFARTALNDAKGE